MNLVIPRVSKPYYDKNQSLLRRWSVSIHKGDIIEIKRFETEQEAIEEAFYTVLNACPPIGNTARLAGVTELEWIDRHYDLDPDLFSIFEESELS